MRKILLAMFSVLMLTSCLKDHNDYFEDSQKQQIEENVRKVFGVTFDANHTWTSATNGSVTVNVPAGTKRVQILALMNQVNEYDEAYTSLTVLNETSVNGETSVTLHYDAPNDHRGLYVSYVSDISYSLEKIGSSATTRSAASTRADVSYTLPSGTFAINTVDDSYASIRGWIPGEKLYSAGSASTVVADYDDAFKETFRTMVFSYFPNGRGFNNLPKVKASGYYNAAVYPITTGAEPIIVMPVYKMDNAAKYGNEVWNSDLYYYYFRESEMGSDPVSYLEHLPKYKAMSFNEYFGVSEDNVVRRNNGYVLMYFGDGTPAEDAVGSFTFPSGYKIGFMVRAKTDAESGKKQGEVYGDGRLNNYINNYSKCNFKSSNLGEDGPRVAWLNVNNHLLMCWESGTDCDFNDIILEVDGGIEKIPVIPEDEYNVYTYCFEDTPFGDYDMNDIVIKAVRKNKTLVEYTIVACGANDELYIKNIDQSIENTEVHKLMGKDSRGFINTVKGAEVVETVKVTKNVSESFSFLDPATQPYIFDKTINHEVKLSKKGEDPHGIMIPGDFRYPQEKIKIKDAYLEFNSWGQNPVTSTTWYTRPQYELVY